MKKSVVTLFLLMMLALPMTAMAAGCSCDDYEMAGGYTYYGQYTSDEHWETYYMTFVCTTCGDTYSMMWNRDTFAHKFSGSECTECGYTRGQTTSCSHMGVYGQGELRDVYESKSSTQHVMIKYRDMICTRCGEWFSEETYRTTKTHLFSGNKCTLCDYTRSGGSSTSSCSHSNHSSKGFGDIVYTPISGGNEHSIERHYKITCKDCGKVITSDYTGRTTESHNFNSAGKCTKCGYSRTDSGNVTATSKPTTQTAGYYIQSTVSFLDGRTTIQWEDSNNNGPYRVQIYQINIEDAELNLYNGKTNDRKITTEKLIPGNKYRVVVTDAKGHETSKYIYIAKGTRFVNGKMNTSVMTVDIDYKTSSSYLIDKWCWVKASICHVKSGPGTEYTTVDYVNKHESYKILDCTIGTSGAEWYMIEIYGILGWVSSGMMSLTRLN